MAVMAGYKQTDPSTGSGQGKWVIPEDWEVKSLGEIGCIATGNTPPTNDAANYGDDFLFVSPVDLGYTKYISRTEKMLSKKGFAISRRFPKDSILFVCIGSTIGKCGIASKDMTSNQQINAIFPAAAFSTDYIYYAVSAVASRIKALAGEQAVPIVNKTQFSEADIALPPTKAEQEAIAEALSDADALIESLEQLIAKKRHLKQAAMQQLLTGKKRLPGFSGKWEVKAFNEVCWFQEGPGVRSFQFTASGIKLLNGTNIFRGVLNLETTNRFISEREASGAYAHFLADAGDIVIASSGITIERFHEKVAFVSEADLPFCMNTSTIRFKPHSGVLTPAFLYHFLASDNFKKMIGGQATGSAQLNFGPSHVAKIIFSLPPPSEQTAIATILSDMDTEIAAIESQLAKTRSLKQGMMHNLLTGKVRLV